jgi:hypothetical protein
MYAFNGLVFIDNHQTELENVGCVGCVVGCQDVCKTLFWSTAEEMWVWFKYAALISDAKMILEVYCDYSSHLFRNTKWGLKRVNGC